MTSPFAPLFGSSLFTLTQAEKEKILLPLFQDLTSYHKAACPAYRKIVDLAFPEHETAKTLSDLPYLPLSIFKHRRLVSAPEENICLSVQSSGARKSQVDLDAATAELAAQMLAATLRTVTGEKKYPLLIVDAPNGPDKEGPIGNRTAATLSVIQSLGQENCTFALKEDMGPDERAMRQFFAEHRTEPFLIFGFTDLIWEKFLPPCEKHSTNLSKAVLLHTGGWRQMGREYIDNETFRNRFRKSTGLSRVVNFYGIAETPGAVFLENADGLFYIPAFADVIIRDPENFKPVENGTPGLIQILSLIPHSFPGHSLLTEDVGIVEAVDTGRDGWNGKAVRFLGRASDKTTSFMPKVKEKIEAA